MALAVKPSEEPVCQPTRSAHALASKIARAEIGYTPSAGGATASGWSREYEPA
jgi:hypothetical protein